MKTKLEIDELRKRHHLLDGQVVAEHTQICPNEIKINALKKEKLKIKDLIHALEVSR